LTICDVADDAKHQWPAFTQLLGIILKYLQYTLELALAYVDMTNCTQLLQRQQQLNLQQLRQQPTASATALKTTQITILLYFAYYSHLSCITFEI